MEQANVETLIARYEALRRTALGQESPRGHGLALVIHRGVSAWMVSWGQLDAGPARPVATNRADSALSAVEIPQLVQTLTSLALGAVRG